MLTGLGSIADIWKSTHPLQCQFHNGRSVSVTFYIVNIPINIWGRDLLSPLGASVTIPSKKLVATAQIPRALPLKWLTNTPKWVEQWSLPQMKLEALEQLVQKQFQLGHIEPSTSP